MPKPRIAVFHRGGADVRLVIGCAGEGRLLKDLQTEGLDDAGCRLREDLHGGLQGVVGVLRGGGDGLEDQKRGLGGAGDRGGQPRAAGLIPEQAVRLVGVHDVGKGGDQAVDDVRRLIEADGADVHAPAPGGGDAVGAGAGVHRHVAPGQIAVAQEAEGGRQQDRDPEHPRKGPHEIMPEDGKLNGLDALLFFHFRSPPSVPARRLCAPCRCCSRSRSPSCRSPSCRSRSRTRSRSRIRSRSRPCRRRAG